MVKSLSSSKKTFSDCAINCIRHCPPLRSIKSFTWNQIFGRIELWQDERTFYATLMADRRLLWVAVSRLMLYSMIDHICRLFMPESAFGDLPDWQTFNDCSSSCCKNLMKCLLIWKTLSIMFFIPNRQLYNWSFKFVFMILLEILYQNESMPLEFNIMHLFD